MNQKNKPTDNDPVDRRPAYLVGESRGLHVRFLRVYFVFRWTVPLGWVQVWPLAAPRTCSSRVAAAV